MSHQDKTAESTRLLLAIEDSIECKTPIYLPELQFVIGKNYQKEGEYEESDQWLKRALKSSDLYSSYDYVEPINLELASNRAIKGDYRGAFEFMKKAYEYSDKNARAELERMNTERDLAMKVMEKEKLRVVARAQARTNRIINVFLAVFLLIVASVAVYAWISLRRRNRLYKHIVMQNVKMLQDSDNYKNRIDELEELVSKREEVETCLKERRENKSRELFERLRHLMAQEEIYRNPRLTREELIEKLDTNATYLTQSIKDNSDMNYSQFINSFRVGAAVKALSDVSRIDVPIKIIAEESGFNSLTTFYKIFQQSVGLSPSAYRKSLINLKVTDKE